MTEWTKESLDALIDGLEPKIAAPGEYSPEWISGFRIGEQALADAILASQPERPSITRESLGAIRGDAVWHIKAETKLPYDTVATVVRAFIEDVLILASQPERVEGLTREKWSVRSIDGRVVCLYCGRGCADASYPQGTCDECGDELTTEIDEDGFVLVTHECKEEE